MLTFLEGIKWKLWLGAIAALLACLPLSYCKGRSDGSALTEAEYAEKRAEALAQAREADAAGVEAAEAGKTLSEAEIERAREAAKDSDDPWRDATEAMR